jgi:hypothetical protein
MFNDTEFNHEFCDLIQLNSPYINDIFLYWSLGLLPVLSHLQAQSSSA